MHLDLAQIVQLALENNPDIAVVESEAAATKYKQEILQSARWPGLSVETSLVHNLDALRLIPASYNGEPGLFDRDIYRGALVLKLPLYTGGRIVNEIRSAELLTQAEEKRLVRTRQELIFNLESTCYSLLGQREVVRSLEFSMAAMAAHRKEVAQLVAAQKAARVDLLRIDVRIADLKQSLEREQNTLAIYQHLLVTLMGIDQAADSLVIDAQLEPTSESPLSAGDLTRRALQQRSDYLAAEHRLAAQKYQVDSAQADNWPKVNLVGSYGVKGALSPDDEGTGAQNNADFGAIGVSLSLALFDGGRTAAQVRQQQALQSAARQRLRKLQQQIRHEVETAVLNIQSNQARLEALTTTIAQAQESLRIERMKFELASGSVTDVLDVQGALLQAETNHARALADYHIARARLNLATGALRP